MRGESTRRASACSSPGLYNCGWSAAFQGTVRLTDNARKKGCTFAPSRSSGKETLEFWKPVNVRARKNSSRPQSGDSEAQVGGLSVRAINHGGCALRGFRTSAYISCKTQTLDSEIGHPGRWLQGLESSQLYRRRSWLEALLVHLQRQRYANSEILPLQHRRTHASLSVSGVNRRRS